MMQVLVWDVDHGSAVYIKTPTGKHIAIDLGVGDMSTGKPFSPLQKLHYGYKVTALDKLVITHPHRDHIDDIANLSLLKPKLVRAVRSIPNEYLINGNQGSDTDAIERYKKLLAEYAPSAQGSPLPTVDWGCELQHFHPAYAGANLNNYSIVTVVSYAGSK